MAQTCQFCPRLEYVSPANARGVDSELINSEAYPFELCSLASPTHLYTFTSKFLSLPLSDELR